MWRILRCDNFDRENVPERFVELPAIQDRQRAQAVADALNVAYPENSEDWYRVVESDYGPKGVFGGEA